MPVAARPVVRRVDDPVHHRVAQVHVGARHVDLGTQHHRTVRKLTRLHARKPVQTLFGGTITERRVRPRLRRVAPVLTDLLGGLLIDVGVPLADQILGPLIEQLEVIARIADLALPRCAHPLDISDDRIDEDLLFFLGVGVVESQQKLPAELDREPVVERDALGVPQVQEPVGLGGEACAHDAPVARRAPAALLDVRVDQLLDEVTALRLGLV